MRKYFFTIAILAFAASLALAGKYDLWQSYTSTKNVRHIELIDNIAHLMTSGGWLQIDPSTMDYSKIVNSDGLGTNDLYHLIEDNGILWLAGHGRLIKEENNAYTPYLFYDRNNNLLDLYYIADDNDQLWIGTSAGLARFSKDVDNGQIEDFYFRFGQLQDESAVNSIIVRSDTIWIATSDGLAFGDIGDPNLLKSYANWGSIKPENYIGTNQNAVSSIVEYDGDIYIGAMNGTYRVDITSLDTALSKVAGIDDVVNRLKVINGTLFVFGDFGVYTYDGLTATAIDISGATDYRPYSSGTVINSDIYIGTENNGIFVGQDGALFSKFNDGGLPGDGIFAVASNGANDVTAALSEDGLTNFDGESWELFDTPVISNGFRNVLYDNNGSVWSGVWGGGLYYIDDDTTIQYVMENSELTGVPGADWYVVVFKTGLHNNRLFMVNYSPSDFNTVKMVDVNDHDRWVLFGINDGLPGDELFSIDATDRYFAAGTSDNGVYYYYFGDDPFDKSDDSVALLNSEETWLGSDQVNSVIFDRDETLWVTTNLGISRYDPGIEKFVNVTLPLGFGPKVNCLEFDLRGNMYIGAMNGLGQYNVSTGEIDIFTSLNSGLPDDEITALSFDSTTLDLWIGTPNGLARLSSNFGLPVSEIEQVVAFPNPYIISDGSESLSFNYGDDATVRIYSVAGELLWENSLNIPWTGTNQNGNDVAPGVYLFLLTAADGSTGKGKILLVRD